jgi:hypothetical protein
MLFSCLDRPQKCLAFQIYTDMIRSHLILIIVKYNFQKFLIKFLATIQRYPVQYKPRYKHLRQKRTMKVYIKISIQCLRLIGTCFCLQGYSHLALPTIFMFRTVIFYVQKL